MKWPEIGIKASDLWKELSGGDRESEASEQRSGARQSREGRALYVRAELCT